MSDRSGIEWTDATWNPTTGCDRVSPGCANCYALTRAPELQKMAILRGAGPTDPYMRDGDPRTSGPGFGLMLHPNRLDQPLRWSKPRRIFVNSMSDLFHPEVPDAFLDRIFAVMALADRHQFQVLTKRPERMRDYINVRWGDGYIEPVYDRADRIHEAMAEFVPQSDHDFVELRWPIPNVWLGTSVENARWRSRIDPLRETAAAVRFLSCEPLLGALTPEEGNGVVGGLDLRGIDWVIAGGESAGPPDRMLVEPMYGGWAPTDDGLAWVRGIRAACVDQGVAFLFKQWGGRTPKSGGRLLDGRTYDEYPVPLAVPV